MSALDAAVRGREYEAAALRLLVGVATALERAAPSAREELLHLLTFDPAGEARATRSRGRGARARGSARPGHA